VSNKVNDWTILRTYYGPLNGHRRKLVEVRCSCGSVEKRRADHVAKGYSKRCKKCSAKKTIADHPEHGWLTHSWSGVGDLSSTYFGQLKSNAAKRNLSFEVTKEYLWELLVAQAFKCALSGVPIELSKKIKGCNVDWAYVTASPDRIDSSRGYVPGNIQWVHKEVNIMKQSHGQQEFIEWCRKIVAHNS
jgi:hypothetical protein